LTLTKEIPFLLSNEWREMENEKLMVLIDEYDRFANKLMFENPDAYDKIVRGTSGDAASSPIRSFLEQVKAAQNARMANYRTLITVISPSDVTKFATVCGFLESDNARALGEIFPGKRNRKHALSVMREYYNGYNFCKSLLSNDQSVSHFRRMATGREWQ
jgi:hypothetical protein